MYIERGNMGKIETRRIIKEYEIFENGASYLELYKDIQINKFSEQLSSEIKDINKLESILKDAGVSHFKICFGEEGHITYPKLFNTKYDTNNKS